jgi:hypothetical protein
VNYRPGMIRSPIDLTAGNPPQGVCVPMGPLTATL